MNDFRKLWIKPNTHLYDGTLSGWLTRSQSTTTLSVGMVNGMKRNHLFCPVVIFQQPLNYTFCFEI